MRARPALAIAVLLTLCQGVALSEFEVHVVRPPTNAIAPDVAVDSRGVLHVVYGISPDAWYVQSPDNGRTFTTPVKVNTTGTVETKMGERGPKIALGRNGNVHVVWADMWAPGVKTYVRYARSTDRGKSFGPVETLSSMSGVDGVTVTADTSGHVLAFWHVMVPPQPDVQSATRMHVARSRDDGMTFAHDEKVAITNHSGLCCAMCMMRARVTADGRVLVAFRSAQESVRDFYVLAGNAGGGESAAARVNEDNWRIDYCPMCGPSLTVTPDGRLLCAFMSSNRVYWSISDKSGSMFSLHVATPDHEKDEIYPCAVANRKGEVLFVWQVGPMATQGSATVKWALYRADGTFTGQSANVGTSFAGTKATAFVGTDGAFYVVTTATRP